MGGEIRCGHAFKKKIVWPNLTVANQVQLPLVGSYNPLTRFGQGMARSGHT